MFVLWSLRFVPVAAWLWYGEAAVLVYFSLTGAGVLIGRVSTEDVHIEEL